MDYISISSGSSGNSHYIKNKQMSVLIDVGVSGKMVDTHLREHNLDLSRCRGILVTHEHYDHIKGIGVISRRYDIPIYASEKTWIELEANYQKTIGKIQSKNQRVFTMDESFSIGDFEISPFATSHDAMDPCGYVLTDTKKKIAVATDLGYVTNGVFETIRRSDLAIIEANYDEEMLRYSSYPQMLKQRIRSKVGHLSNVDALELAAALIQAGTTDLVLAHLSKENNMPLIAEQVVMHGIESMGIKAEDYQLSVAKRNQVSKLFRL